ncbi:MAG: pilus assembly protein TadG-related protein [Bryobacteraceae bacterium]
MKKMQTPERGFTLLSAGVCAIVLMGMVGLAVDVGRMYIVKSEAQVYVDSAAVAAALELDGTLDGLERARTAARNGVNRWNLATQVFSSVLTDFATQATGPWNANPSSGANHAFVRVRAIADTPIYFMTVIDGRTSSDVAAVGAAGQVPKTSFREGLFPFSPYAHNNSAPHFGLNPGTHYTLRWPANPKLNQNICPGDNHPAVLNTATAGGGEERGFIEQTSSSIIRQTIEADYQSVFRVLGESVNMTGGAKQTQVDSIRNRVNQDSDPTSTTYAQYLSRGQGNGRRLVVAPINTGHPNYRIVNFGLFFLLTPGEYHNGANKPFCAEYVGSWVQGSRNKGVAATGAYVVRLVQ